MPLFLVTTLDKPDALELRLTKRPEHLAWLNAQGGTVKVAGARWSDAAEPKPYGSTLLVEAENLAAARTWAAQDPFAKSGVFAEIKVEEIRPAVGAWVPKV